MGRRMTDQARLQELANALKTMPVTKVMKKFHAHHGTVVRARDTLLSKPRSRPMQQITKKIIIDIKSGMTFKDIRARYGFSRTAYTSFRKRHVI